LAEEKRTKEIVESEKERKTAKVSLTEILGEVIGKLSDEILVFGVGLVLIIAIIVMFAGQFPPWAAIAIVTIYAVAAVYSIYTRSIETKDKLEKALQKVIEWTYSRPRAFQNPLKTDPTLRIVHFSINFKLKNHAETGCILRVYIKSTTQAVVFPLDSPIKVWKRAYGIVPYREEVRMALDNMIEQKISAGSQGEYNFHGWYRPLFAHEDYQYKRRIVILCRVEGKSDDGKWIVDSHYKRMEIPFRDKVKYAKHLRE